MNTEIVVVRTDYICSGVHFKAVLTNLKLRVILDVFGLKCTEDAAEECNEFRPEVPLSKQFNADAFELYCG